MWRLISLSIIGLLMIFPDGCMAGEAEFREVRWGMTKIEVMAVETLQPESFAGPILTYRTALLGKEMYLIYEFIDNKLVDAMYVFLVNDKTDYGDVIGILKKKYGAPFSVREKDANDYYFKWRTPFTEIEMKPWKGNACSLLYTSVKLKSYVLKEEKKRAIQKEKELLKLF